MSNKERILNRPNYLLKRYQNEIFRQLKEYKDKHTLTQSDLAKELGVSSSYISQILNGQFNFTLKKLIELALLVGKVPIIEFVDKSDYWVTRSNIKDVRTKITWSSPGFVVQNIVLNEEQIKRVRAASSGVTTSNNKNLKSDLTVPVCLT